jgi:hypothetical protein
MNKSSNTKFTVIGIILVLAMSSSGINYGAADGLSLFPVHIQSNNLNPQQAKPGDVVALSFTSSTAIRPPVVTIQGQPPAALTNVIGNTWVATRTITSGDPDGAVQFTIDFTSTTGNIGTQVTATTDASSVIIETDPPVFTTVHIQSNNPNNQFASPGNIVTLSFITDEQIQVPSVMLNGFPPMTLTNPGADKLHWVATRVMPSTDLNGPVTFSITAIQVEGGTQNTATATNDETSVTFTKSVPHVHITTPANNHEFSDVEAPRVVHVTGTASDPVVGISIVKVSIDGGAFTTATGTTSWTFDTLALSFSDCGDTHTIQAQATNNAGLSATSSITHIKISDLDTPC